jgi:hypothetical protein
METKSSLLLHRAVLEVMDADEHYIKQLPHDPKAQKEMMEKVGEDEDSDRHDWAYPSGPH